MELWKGCGGGGDACTLALTVFSPFAHGRHAFSHCVHFHIVKIKAAHFNILLPQRGHGKGVKAMRGISALVFHDTFRARI